MGHTPAEFVALMSARQDLEDVVQEAAKRQAMRRWEAQYDAGLQGDVSAPTARQLAEEELMQGRAKRERARYDQRWTLMLAREQTARQIRAAER